VPPTATAEFEWNGLDRSIPLDCVTAGDKVLHVLGKSASKLSARATKAFHVKKLVGDRYSAGLLTFETNATT
jgi:hypothetical protein